MEGELGQGGELVTALTVWGRLQKLKNATNTLVVVREPVLFYSSKLNIILLKLIKLNKLMYLHVGGKNNNQWSKCTKTCGVGSRYRFDSKNCVSVYNAQCNRTFEECNTQPCQGRPLRYLILHNLSLPTTSASYTLE